MNILSGARMSVKKNTIIFLKRKMIFSFSSILSHHIDIHQIKIFPSRFYRMFWLFAQNKHTTNKCVRLLCVIKVKSPRIIQKILKRTSPF